MYVVNLLQLMHSVHIVAEQLDTHFESNNFENVNQKRNAKTSAANLTKGPQNDALNSFSKYTFRGNRLRSLGKMAKR
jgi:hypothetical protein